MMIDIIHNSSEYILRLKSIQYNFKFTSIRYSNLLGFLVFSCFSPERILTRNTDTSVFWHTDTNTYLVFFRLNTDTDTFILYWSGLWFKYSCQHLCLSLFPLIIILQKIVVCKQTLDFGSNLIFESTVKSFKTREVCLLICAYCKF